MKQKMFILKPLLVDNEVNQKMHSPDYTHLDPLSDQVLGAYSLSPWTPS